MSAAARAVLLAALVLAPAASACDDTVCVRRGARSTFAGPATLTSAASNDPSPDGGAAPGTIATRADGIVIDDLDPFPPGQCQPNAAEFTLHVGAADCTLRAVDVDDRHDTGKDSDGAFIYERATIAPGATCAMTLDQADVVFVVDDGALTLTPGAADLTLSGQAQPSTLTPSEARFVTYHFQGSGPM